MRSAISWEAWTLKQDRSVRKGLMLQLLSSTFIVDETVHSLERTPKKKKILDKC